MIFQCQGLGGYLFCFIISMAWLKRVSVKRVGSTLYVKEFWILNPLFICTCGGLEAIFKRSLPCLWALIQVPTEPMSDSLSFRHPSWLHYSVSTREGQLYSELDCLLAHIGQYLSGSIKLLYSNYLPGNTISDSLLPNSYLSKALLGEVYLWIMASRLFCLPVVPHNLKSTVQ